MTPVANHARYEIDEQDTEHAPGSLLSIVRSPDDRRSRAERRERADVKWVSTVKLGWGLEVRLVNMSSTGLLLETGSKLTPGSITELRLCGPDTDITIPVRFVRSEVADATHLGVRYHTAATFEKPLPSLLKLLSAAESDHDREGTESDEVRECVAKSLGGLLSRVSAELGDRSHPNLRVALEAGVRRVMDAQEVRITMAPFDVIDDRESVSVAVPTSTGSPATLQAHFAPGWQPTDLDLKLLTAAAGLAAVVLEFGE